MKEGKNRNREKSMKNVKLQVRISTQHFFLHNREILQQCAINWQLSDNLTLCTLNWETRMFNIPSSLHTFYCCKVRQFVNWLYPIQIHLNSHDIVNLLLRCLLINNHWNKCAPHEFLSLCVCCMLYTHSSLNWGWEFSFSCDVRHPAIYDLLCLWTTISRPIHVYIYF